MIKQVGKNDTDDVKLITTLTFPLTMKPTSNVELIDYTRSEKKVLVSIRNLSHWPADRISQITVNLKINDTVFKLLSCNRLQTETQTVDLGKLNYSNSNSTELNASSSAALNVGNGIISSYENTSSNKLGDLNYGSKNTSGETGTHTSTSSAGLGGKFNASRSFSEEVLLKQRLVTLNASISKNTLSLYQQSISGIDLSGNIIADISFDSPENIAVVSTYSFAELFKSGIANNSEKLKVKETLIKFFNYKKDITAELSYSADFRHVTQRHTTITESDDVIELVCGKTDDSKIQTIGFFSGAGGLDIGSQLAGSKVISSLDFDRDSVATMKANKYFAHSKHFHRDIKEMFASDYTKVIKDNKPEKLILVGGPPCQPFSKAGYWVTHQAHAAHSPHHKQQRITR